MSNRTQNSLFASLDQFVIKDHPYRKLDTLISFTRLAEPLQVLYSEKGRKEKGAEFALRCLVLQFMEDLSDREMTRYLQENMAAKWFCDMRFETLAPHHGYFGEFRKRLGTQRLMTLFDEIRAALKNEGLIREVFTFIDASQLISKLNVWDDRDKAIKQKMDTFNNATAAKIAADKQARFGCKGKGKHWFGYKEHVSVDMQSGLINKVAATPANVTDAQAAEHVTQACIGMLKDENTKSITFDNGKEFAGHQTIASALNTEIFFAKPYHSWERGTNENTNGLIRQFLPKSMPFDSVSDKDIRIIEDNLSNRPRKVLGYQTPLEVKSKFGCVALQS